MKLFDIYRMVLEEIMDENRRSDPGSRNVKKNGEI